MTSRRSWTIAERIGTFETSIQPFEDCCTIFVAKHPVTKPNVEVIRRSEKKLDGEDRPAVPEGSGYRRDH